MKKNKMIIRIFIIIFLAIIIFTLSMISMEQKENTIQTSAENISNKKISWGIKRNNNHEQPDVGKDYQQILEENGGICLGDKETKNIYLTFDEGYEAGYTEQILDILKENDVKATFFLTAHYVNTQEELVKRMIDEGHIIGNHTVNHKSMPSCTNETIKEEVMTLHQNVYEKFNYEMKYMRPPKGEYSEASIAYTNTLGYTTVMWSFAYDDWVEDNQGREEYAKSKIYDNLHNGEIMLLHATSKDNANILDEVIKEIKNQGYEFKSLDEFVR